MAGTSPAMTENDMEISDWGEATKQPMTHGRRNL
jgi:hypothetical protein